MRDDEVLKELMKASQSFESYSVQRFLLYRKTKSGETQRVDIEVLDAGEEQANRFSIHAHTQDGKTASGNPNKSLSAAIALVHWGNLG